MQGKKGSKEPGQGHSTQKYVKVSILEILESAFNAGKFSLFLDAYLTYNTNIII
jgi:hypothetical protein